MTPPTRKSLGAEELRQPRTRPATGCTTSCTGIPALSPLIVLIVACIVFGLADDRSCGPQNLSLLLQQVAVVGSLGSRADADHPDRRHRPVDRRGDGPRHRW